MGMSLAPAALLGLAESNHRGHRGDLYLGKHHGGGKVAHPGRNGSLDNSRYNDYTRFVSKGIRAEIKQNKPFRSLEAEALLSLLRSAEKLQARVAAMLKPYGLSPTQYNALRILRGAGKKGLACSEIGERMINRDPDITRLMDRLERHGLVKRSRDQKDRRVTTARITAGGLELLKSLDRPVDEFQRELLGHMGAQRLRTLIRLLETARGQAEA